MEAAPSSHESDDSSESSSSSRLRMRGEAALRSAEKATESRPQPPAEKPVRSWLNLSESAPKPPAVLPHELASKAKPEASESSEDEESEFSDETVAKAEALLENNPDAVAKVVRQKVGLKGKEAVAAQATAETAQADLAVNHMYDEVIVDGDPDVAFEHAAALLGFNSEEIATIVAADRENNPADETGEASEAEDGTETVELPGEAGGDDFGFRMSLEAMGESGDDDDEDAVTPATTGTTATGGGMGGAAVPPATGGGGRGAGPTPPTTGGFGGGHGGGMPPHGPAVGFGGGAAGGPGGGGRPAGYNAYHAPVSTAPNSQPGPENYIDDGNNAAVNALIGGIIGYFIGRRRGRIKTEKRLLPIQKKLEKQVDNLQWELRRKETSLRRLAAERAPQVQTPVGIEAMAAAHMRSEAAPAHVVERQVAAGAAAESRPSTSEAPTARTERHRAPEANQLHGATKTKEHIGHMLIAAEAIVPTREARSAAPSEAAGPQRREAQPNAVRSEAAPLATERRVETMSRAELLSMSEKITIDGSSLRQIYETNLVSERGLRRLITEHLRGGDIKKALRAEIVEHEIDFERDPAMRDIGSVSGGGTAATGSAHVALNQMVERAAAQVSGTNEDATFYKATNNPQAEDQQKSHKHQQLVDAGLVLIIVILVALVVMMYLKRH